MCIKGGYILQPRSIDESEVSKFPPHVREIWLYFLRKANHKDETVGGRLIKRGQLITSYSEIIEDLSWYVGYRKESYKRHHCETAMKLMKKAAMITTTKATHKMIVTICKYDVYQSPENYESYNETDNETDDGTETKHDTIYKKEERRIKEEIYKEEKPLKKAEEKLKEMIKPFVKIYGPDMCNQFYLYWSEPNKSKTKARYEMEKTWDISRRLSRWNNNQSKIGNGKETVQAKQFDKL